MLFTQSNPFDVHQGGPCSARLGIGRRLVIALCVLVWFGSAMAQGVAAAKVAHIAAPEKSLVVPTVVGSFNLPLGSALEPEKIWQYRLPISKPANPTGVWSIDATQLTAAKFTLAAHAEHIYTLEFPVVRLDQVDVFWRTPGGPWGHGRAGDTVALSQWPVVGQYPTFVLHFASLPATMDVLVVMKNVGFAEVSSVISADRESRERRLLQANAAGLMIGASVMVLLICLLMSAVYRSPGTIYLLVYCVAVTLGAVLINGYGAIWFTPEWPYFNDSSKPFAASLISAAMLCVCLACLNRDSVSSLARSIAWVLVAALLALGIAQATVLSPVWRLAGGAGGAAVVIVMGLGLGIDSWRRGDRLAYWVVIAVVLFACSAAVVTRGFFVIRGVDVFSTLTTAFLLSSILALRQVLVLRERYGRDVLGRAETNRYRDPLTALLSYEGFERAVENLSVRQHSGGGVAQLLYFSLQELDNFRAQDGYVVWQRDLVRFAAVLHKVLGEGWHIARLSNSKFGAVRLDDDRKLRTEPLLTLVLSSCARKIDTQGWVDRVGLRMAGASTPLTSTGLKDGLRVLEQTLQELPPGKRIALL